MSPTGVGIMDPARGNLGDEIENFFDEFGAQRAQCFFAVRKRSRRCHASVTSAADLSGQPINGIEREEETK
jgi:hypothetical protein